MFVLISQILTPRGERNLPLIRHSIFIQSPYDVLMGHGGALCSTMMMDWLTNSRAVDPMSGSKNTYLAVKYTTSDKTVQ